MKQTESFIRQFFRVLPQDLGQSRREVEKTLRAALTATFAKLGLVTREEFDAQTELLRNARAELDELEKKTAELEKKPSPESQSRL